MKKFFKISSNKNKGSTDGFIRRRSSSVSSLDFTSTSTVFTSNYPKIDDLLKDKNFTKLHNAAYVGDLSKVERLVKKINVNEVDSELRTPLHLASSNAHKEVIWFLLGSKAKPNLYDSDGNTPLLKAIQCGHCEIVQFLLDRGADPKSKNKDGDTGLHLATRNGHTDIVMALVQKKAVIDAQNEEGQTPLIVAVTNFQTEIFNTLLRHGASVRIKDNNQRTCLMFGCENGSTDIVRLILNEDVDIEASNNLGHTARDIARMSGNDDCVRLIEDTLRSQQERSRKLSIQLQENPSLVVGSPALNNVSFDDEDVHSRHSMVDSRADFDDADLDSWNDDDGSIETPPKKTVDKIGTNLSKFLNKIDETVSQKSSVKSEEELEKNGESPPAKPKRTNVSVEIEISKDETVEMDNGQQMDLATSELTDDMIAKRNRDLMAELGLSDISEFSSSIHSLASKKDQKSRDEDTDLDVDFAEEEQKNDDDAFVSKTNATVVVSNENHESRLSLKDADVEVKAKILKTLKESDDESDWDGSENSVDEPIRIKPIGLLLTAKRDSMESAVAVDQHDASDENVAKNEVWSKTLIEDKVEDKNAAAENKVKDKNVAYEEVGDKNVAEDDAGDKINAAQDKQCDINGTHDKLCDKNQAEDEALDKSDPTEQKKFNTMSSEGTLGRFGTMHEVEEVWERNQCLDLATDDHSGSASGHGSGSSKDDDESGSGVFRAELVCLNSPEHLPRQEEDTKGAADLLWKQLWVHIFGASGNESDSNDEVSSTLNVLTDSDNNLDVPINLELSFTDDPSNSISARDDRTFELLAFVRNPTNASRVLRMIQQLRRSWNTELACCKGLTDKINVLESEVKLARSRTESWKSTHAELSSIQAELKRELETVKRSLAGELERNDETKLVLQKKQEQLEILEEKYFKEVSDRQKTELQLRSFQMEVESSQLLVLQSREEHKKELDEIHRNRKSVTDVAIQVESVEQDFVRSDEVEVIRNNLLREEAERRFVEKEVKELRDQVSKYMVQLAQMDKASSEKDLEEKKTVADLEAKSSESVLQLNLLTQESKAKEALINQLKEMLQKQKQETERLDTELFEAKKSLSAAQSDSLTLKLQLDSNSRLDVARQETETCLQSRWEGIIEKFRHDFEATEKVMIAKNLSLTKMVSSLQEELQQSNECMLEKCKELNAAHLNTSQLTIKADGAKADMEKSHKKMTELQNDCDDLRQRYDEVKRQLKEATNYTEAKSNELESAAGRMEILKEKLSIVEAKSTTAENELSSFRIDAAKEIQCLQAEILATTMQIKATEEQLKSMTQKLTLATSKTEQLQVDLNKKQFQLKAATEQIVTLNEKLHNTKEQMEQQMHISQPDVTTAILEDSCRTFHDNTKQQDATTANLENGCRFQTKKIMQPDATTTIIEDGCTTLHDIRQPDATYVRKEVAAEKDTFKPDNPNVRMMNIEKEVQQLRTCMNSFLELQRPDEDVNNLCGKTEMIWRSLQEEKLKQQRSEEQMSHLQEQLVEAHSLLKHVRQFRLQCGHLSGRGLRQVADTHSNCVDRNELDLLAKKLEMQSSYEINQKLEHVNSFLAEQNKLSSQKELLHNQSESQLRHEYSTAIQELKAEVVRLQQCLRDKDARQVALEDRYRELCELIETKRRIKAKLTIDANSSSKRRSRGHNLQTNSKPPYYSSSTRDFHAISAISPPNVTQSLQMLPQYYTNNPITAKNVADDGRSFKLREELDRSIGQHLNSAPIIDIYGLSSRQLSTTNLDTAHYDKAASDYLSSLKRNYLF